MFSLRCKAEAILSQGSSLAMGFSSFNIAVSVESLVNYILF